MTSSKRSLPWPGGDPLELSSLGGVDVRALSQADNSASCTSMRVAELRLCLLYEISRVIAVGRLAQEALLDDDDATALDNLRWHWRVMRAGIAPLAAELKLLGGQRT
jgi:hypothetical protein